MAFLVPVTAFAQTGSLIQRQQTSPASPIERDRPPEQPPILPRLQQPAPTPPQLQPDEGPSITVSRVQIEGATVYPTEELTRLLADVVGQPVAQGRIEEAVQRIQLQYRTDGYFLSAARGTVEPTPTGPVLMVRVIEGFISAVKIDGEIGPAGTLVYDFLNHLPQFRPVNIADVERYLLLAQNVPGVTLRAVLRPATGEAGSVELVAQVTRKSYDLTASFDNRGSRFAGPGELLLSGQTNSFTSLGDRTSLTLFNTPFNDQQIFGQLSEELYAGSDGLVLRAFVGYGLSQPADILALTGYHGRLLLAGGSATYPVIRTRPLSFSVSGSLDITQSSIDLEAGTSTSGTRQSNSNLRVVRFTGLLDTQDDWLGDQRAAANSLALTVHKGLRGLGASGNNDPLPARPGVINDFLKYSLQATRVQNLLQVGGYAFALKLAAAGQYTQDVLPPSEKFFLGGTQFGRGFYSGEVTGDRTVAGTVELQVNTTIQGRSNLFNLPYDLGVQYYGFYDTGQTWDRGPSALRLHLESVGLGARVTITPQYAVELEGVHRFTRRPASQSPDVSLEKADTVFVRLIGRF